MSLASPFLFVTLNKRMKECFCSHLMDRDFWQNSLVRLPFLQSSNADSSLLYLLTHPLHGPLLYAYRVLPFKMQTQTLLLSPPPPTVPSWLTPPCHQCMSAPLYHFHAPVSLSYTAHYNLATLEYARNLKIHPLFLGTWDHLILPHLYGLFWSSSSLILLACLFGRSGRARLKLSPGLAFSPLSFPHPFVFLRLLPILTVHLRSRSFQGSIFSFIHFPP